MSAAPEEYPQIRTMFTDALKAMAEGETEAEKQIVYVLNEARAALPCPSFVARMDRALRRGSFALYAVRRGKPLFIVGARKGSVMGDCVPAPRRRKGSVEPTEPPAERFTVFFTPESADGDGHLADGEPSLLRCLAGAIQTAYLDIMQAAAEAGQMAPHASRVGGISVADAMVRFERLRAPVSSEVAPGETVKSADVLVTRDVMPVENYGNWVLSFAGPHPTEDQVVHVTDRDQAFKAKRLIDSLLTR